MADKRNIVVSFRLTGIEAAHVDAAGRMLSVPRGRGDYARAAALFAAKQKLPEPAKPIRRPARRQPGLDIQILARILASVGSIANDVNRLAKTANATDTFPVGSALASVADDLMTIRDQITAVLRGGKLDEVAP